MTYLIQAQNWLARLDGPWRFLFAIAMGFLSAFSLPPIGAWPLLFVTLPAFYCLADRKETSWRRAFGLGFCFGFGYFLWALHWIGFAFLVDANDYLWMMPFAVLGLVAFLSLYWGAALVAVYMSGRRGLSGFLIFVAALAVAEYFRGILLTGFPWGAPGQIAIAMGPVAQLAAWCGMQGLSLLIPLWAGVWLFVFVAPTRLERRVALALLVTLPVAFVMGTLRINLAPADSSTGITVRLVQPNIPQSDKWRGDNAVDIYERLMALSAQPVASGPVPQIIIWPESALPYLLDEASESRSLIGEMLGPGRVLISGSLRRIVDPSGDYTKDRVFNSVLVINDKGDVIDAYDKWKLVPGGEFLPFETLLAPLGFRKVVTLPGSFEAGQGARSIKLPQLPSIGLSVCYEAIFPGDLVDENQRPEWLANVTNDGWFGNSIGPYAHFSQARLRAIEEGLPLLRAANTGISGGMNGYGQVIAQSSLGESGVVDVKLPKPFGRTFFSQFGGIILMLLNLFVFGLALIFRR